MTSTQTNHPWRATVRTVIQAGIAAAAAAPLVYNAVTQASPATSTGAAAVFLTVAGAVTRVASLPAVDQFLRRFIPWLAPDPAGSSSQEAVPDSAGQHERRNSVNSSNPPDQNQEPHFK
jgi:hypothetical protein